MTKPPNEASRLATEIAKIIDGAEADDIMAALTCVTAGVLATIGVPAGEALDGCIGLFVKQVREHHVEHLKVGLDS